MKIFKFDPKTGKRGDFIESVALASHTDQGVDYQVENGIIEPIDYRLPPERKDQNWTVHVGAGVFDACYLRDEWICFCLGEWVAGPGPGVWEWVVLPPKQLIKRIEK